MSGPFRYSVIWHHTSADWGDGLDCMMRRDVSISTGVGSLIPFKIEESAPSYVASVSLSPELSSARDCERASVTPMTFAVATGKVRRSIRLADQCYLESIPKSLPFYGDSWYLRTSHQSGPELLVYASGPSPESFVVEVSRTTNLIRARLTANKKQNPPIVFDQASDGYFNYCVRLHPDTIRKKNGRLFCIKPGDALVWWRDGPNA